MIMPLALLPPGRSVSRVVCMTAARDTPGRPSTARPHKASRRRTFRAIFAAMDCTDIESPPIAPCMRPPDHLPPARRKPAYLTAGRTFCQLKTLTPHVFPTSACSTGSDRSETGGSQAPPALGPKQELG